MGSLGETSRRVLSLGLKVTMPWVMVLALVVLRAWPLVAGLFIVIMAEGFDKWLTYLDNKQGAVSDDRLRRVEEELKSIVMVEQMKRGFNK